MKEAFVAMAVLLADCVAGKEENDVEARGKGKYSYALWAHLGILVAAKVGLYKLLLGIGLVIGVIKVMVFMAWVLAICKYMPDFWSDYEHDHHGFNHHDFHGFNKFGSAPYGNYDWFMNLLRRVHFLYVVATKVFVLKVVYGALFYIIASKAWHFIIWFLHFLKEKKEHHYEYVEHEFEHHPHHHDHYGTYDHAGYGTIDHDPYGGYGKSDYGHKKRIYDSDGSYSVKNPNIAA